MRGGSVQDGQYLDYVYRVHKVRFAQLFRDDLERLGLTAEEALGADYVPRSEIFDMTSALHDEDDTVQVLEHWFRQPVETAADGETIPAGAVACSIQAGGHELRYIPNYWKRTCDQNALFPFVHYWRIQDENRFWNKSELAAILDLVDAADRKLAAALLNDSFLSNDILLVEDGALADGDKVQLVGRFQSRAYQKQLADGNTLNKVAYEVSVSRLTSVREDAPLHTLNPHLQPVPPYQTARDCPQP